MDDLTPRQRELFQWIRDFIAEHHFAPTLREQAEGIKVKSPAPVQSLLGALRERGYVDWKKGKARSIQILKNFDIGVPILGAIGASPLLETYAEAEVQHIPIEVFTLLGYTRQEASKLFAVKVRGDSMIDAAIAPGDLVILKPPTDPNAIKDGTIVAARVGSQMTLKHYHRIDDEHIQLRPANPRYEPIDVLASELDIQGVYVSLMRGFL